MKICTDGVQRINYFCIRQQPNNYYQKKLISENIWNEYLKIGIVRNPYSRAVSGYFWLMNNTQIRDSFRNYILRGGKFKSLLNDNSSNKFRGDHLWLQKDFLYFENKLVLDKLYFFENLDEIFNDLKKMCI
jgi:hypothetical protein